MPLQLLEALIRTAKLGGLRSPLEILAKQREAALPWWVK